MQKTFLIFLIAVSFSFSQNVKSLQEIIETSLENNYSIRIGKLSRDIAENNATYGNAGMLPKVDVFRNYDYAYDIVRIETPASEFPINNEGIATSLNTGFSLNWTLFDGLAMFINYEKFKTLTDQSKVQLQLTIENNIRDITNAYFTAVELKQNMRTLSSANSLTKNRLERLEAKAEYGSSSSVLSLQAKVDLNTDSTNYLNSELAYRNLIRQLNFLMGEKAFEMFDVDENVVFETLPEKEELLDLTLRMNNSINQAVMQETLSNYDRRLILASMMPRLGLNAGFTNNKIESEAGFFSLNESESSNIGLSFSFNVFDGFKKQTALENAKVMQEMANVTTEQVKSSILLAFENAYDNYSRRKIILEFEEDNIGIAELNLDRTEQLFNLGNATGLELREAQLNLIRTQNRINTAKAQLKIAETELLLISGSMLK